MAFDIIQQRLLTQQLSYPSFERPEDVVTWFGAIQAQDFAAAKWAISLRSKNQTDADIEKAFNEGKILRIHIMRPTWHFVNPQDIRWLLALTAPRVQHFNGHYYRKSGLDKTIFDKSNKVIKKALEGSKQLTRDELHTYLKEAHIPTDNLGLSFTIVQAELEGIIVSGPRLGKQFTYMLLDERVPATKPITNNEALMKLTKRYFQSHGPAQIKDFCWWSGLTSIDAKKGIEMLGSTIISEVTNDKIYWYISSKEEKTMPLDGYLVPGFDEYFIAYKDRSDILDSEYIKRLNQGGGMVNGAVVLNGKMVGGWKRTFVKKDVVITITLFEKISDEQKQAVLKQAERFGKFLSIPIIININLSEA